MRVPYSAFLSRVLVDVPTCPEIVATQALQDTVIEFCERTLAYQQDIVMGVESGVNEYLIETQSDERVAKLMRVFYKDQELRPFAPDAVSNANLYREIPTDSQADPKQYTQKGLRTIVLMPTPKDTVVDALTLRVALQPTRASEQIDGDLFEEYAEVIAHGAKARLMLSPNKPYSDKSLGAAEKGFFNTGINAAILRANKGRVRAATRMKLRRI